MKDVQKSLGKSCNKKHYHSGVQGLGCYWVGYAEGKDSPVAVAWTQCPPGETNLGNTAKGSRLVDTTTVHTIDQKKSILDAASITHEKNK